MECRAVVSSLSEYLDGWSSDNVVREIEDHLVTCPKCQSVKLELGEIKTAARELPLHTPPRAMWRRIANTIEMELAAEYAPTRLKEGPNGWWARLKSRKFTLTFPQLAGLGVLALALITFGVFNFSIPNQGTLKFTDAQTALFANEDQIKAELERRLSAINMRKAYWDPQVRDEFDRHLGKIEESLKNCRQTLQNNPGDKVQQQLVLSLYEEKRQLLADVERLKW